MHNVSIKTLWSTHLQSSFNGPYYEYFNIIIKEKQLQKLTCTLTGWIFSFNSAMRVHKNEKPPNTLCDWKKMETYIYMYLLHFYDLNFEDVERAYGLFLWFHPSHVLNHAISYEPCVLGFWNFICVWNFIYGFLLEKQPTWNFVFVWVISISDIMPLWKTQNEILSARYLEKYLS